MIPENTEISIEIAQSSDLKDPNKVQLRLGANNLNIQIDVNGNDIIKAINSVLASKKALKSGDK